MKLYLHRTSIVADGAFGVLKEESGKPICLTLEHTFENLRTVITPGNYTCIRTQYYKGGYPTFEIQVPGHSRVLFHKGNTEDDSEGCVLLGTTLGRLKDKAAVLQSAPAYAAFWGVVKNWPQFELEVS